MKNNLASPRPRLVCRVVRLSRALFENTGRAHLAGCADCQEFVRTADELDRELQRAGVALRRAAPEPSTGLEREIMRAVRDGQAKAAPQSSHSRFRVPVWTMGATVAAAVAVVIYLQRPAGSNPGRAVREDALAVVDAVENFSVKLTGTVIPATGAMVANNPLQRELGSVYSDARSALNFLALNFLPAASAPAAPESPQKI